MFEFELSHTEAEKACLIKPLKAINTSTATMQDRGLGEGTAAGKSVQKCMTF